VLNAIDRHELLYRQTGLGWHAAKAQELRWYISELKDWIHCEEATISHDQPSRFGLL
jgi:hypothetical protein